MISRPAKNPERIVRISEKRESRVRARRRLCIKISWNLQIQLIITIKDVGYGVINQPTQLPFQLLVIVQASESTAARKQTSSPFMPMYSDETRMGFPSMRLV